MWTGWGVGVKGAPGVWTGEGGGEGARGVDWGGGKGPPGCGLGGGGTGCGLGGGEGGPQPAPPEAAIASPGLQLCHIVLQGALVAESAASSAPRFGWAADSRSLTRPWATVGLTLPLLGAESQ